MASYNDVRKNLLNDMADRNRIGGDEAGAGVWGAMADGKMTAANCDELAEEMKHATGLTLQRKRANEATASEKRSVGQIHEADRIAYEKKVSSEAAKMQDPPEQRVSRPRTAYLGWSGHWRSVIS